MNSDSQQPEKDTPGRDFFVDSGEMGARIRAYERATAPLGGPLEVAQVQTQAAEVERERLYEVYMQAPAITLILRGPNHVVELANPLAAAVIGLGRDFVGKPIRQALPELEGQVFISLLDNVYTRGEPFVGSELPAWIDHNGDGTPEEYFFNFVYQPYRDAEGHVQGVFVHAVDVTEQVLARRKVEQSESLLSNTLERVSDAFLAVDSRWRFTYLNSRVEALFGRSKGDLLGKNLWEEFPAFRESGFYSRFHQAVESQEPVTFEEFSPLVDRWYRIHAYPSTDGLSVYFTDITEQKRSEELLARQGGLLEQSHDAIFAWELGGPIIYWNKGAEDLYGFTKDQALGQVSHSLLRTLHRHGRDLVEEALKREGEWEGELVHITSDKKEIIVESRHQLINEPDGRQVVLEINRDITDRKQVESKLRHAATLNEHIADALVATNNDYRITSWNAGAEKLYGWREDEVIGRLAAEVIPTEFPDSPDGRREWQEALAAQGSWTGEVIQQRKDGRKVHVLASVTALTDEKGHRVGGVAVNRDITERKQAEERAKLLTHLSEAIRTANDPEELTWAASRLVGEQLHARRCFFAEIDLATDTGNVRRDYTDGVPSVAGPYRVSAYSSITEEELKAGQTVVNNDSKRDMRTAAFYEETYEPAGERAYVAVPLIRARAWVGTFWVSDNTPRRWTTDEVALLEAVAERVWSAVERLHNEQALRESEERYRSIVDQSVAGITETDAEGFFTTVNDHYCELTGYTREELLKMRRHDMTHPDDLPRSLEMFERLAEGGPAFEIEKRYIRKDGSEVWVHNSVSAIRDPNGKVRSLITVVIDINERVNFQEKIRRSEEQLRAVFDTTTVGVATLTPDTRFIQVNDAFCDITGYSRQELLALDCGALTHPDDLPRMQEKIDALLAGEIPSFVIERRYIRKGGAVIWVQNSVSLVHDAEGKPLHLVAVSQDVTERRKLEQRKDDFIALASHELKTPITSLKMSAQLLRRRLQKASMAQAQEQGQSRPTSSEAGDSFVARQLGRMDEQLDKLTELVNDLLDVSRIEAGKLHYHMEEVDIAALIKDCVDELGFLSDKHAIVITHLAQGTVTCDRDRIGQVLTNFLTNAIKFSPEADRVEVSSEAHNGEVTVSVRDFGIGVPPEDREKIFDRFFQVSSMQGGGGTYPGLGLGLYISAQIIKSHGGRIWVESEQGKGSTFYFTLPLATTESSQATS